MEKGKTGTSQEKETARVRKNQGQVRKKKGTTLEKGRESGKMSGKSQEKPMTYESGERQVRTFLKNHPLFHLVRSKKK